VEERDSLPIVDCTFSGRSRRIQAHWRKLTGIRLASSEIVPSLLGKEIIKLFHPDSISMVTLTLPGCGLVMSQRIRAGEIHNTR
jgi:hypothetical protein